MQSFPSHKVGKISIALQASSQAGLHALMDRASKAAQEVTNQSIDGWWTRFSNSGFIQIDKIEVDLGHLSRDALPKSLKLELDTAIQKALVGFETASDGAKQQSFNVKSHGLARTFHFYLTHGCLPWNCKQRDFNFDEAFEVAVKENSIEEWRHLLLSENVRIRLSGLLSEENFQQLLIFLSPELQRRWAAIDRSWKMYLSSWLNDRKSGALQFHKLYSRNVRTRFLLWIVNQIQPTEEEFAQLWMITYQGCLSSKELKKFIKHLDDTYSSKMAFESSEMRLMSKVVKDLCFDDVSLVKDSIQYQTPESTTKKDKTSAVKEQSGSASSPGFSESSQTTSESPGVPGQDALNEIKTNRPGDREQQPINEYFIENAGLIILWPGLKHLFKRCEFLESDQFLDKKTQQRAATLLHYLCSNKQSGSEFEMVFNKILCGLDPEWPMYDQVQLSKEEVEAAREVRAEVHQQWEATKKLSEGELITNFFLREGKLTRQENGWLLQVERKAWDLLLDRLPWSIGVIRLPWQEGLIYVEW